MSRIIKFDCIITGNNKELIGRYNEWLDGDGWKHDYYSPLVTNDVFNHQELGDDDGWFGNIVRRQFTYSGIIRRQFTGLQDKNGKDIYDGDILQSFYSRDTTGKDIVNTQEVVEYQIDEYTGEAGYELLFIERAVIIGNIYENPELLTP
jgi:hypothetical protein